LHPRPARRRDHRPARARSLVRGRSVNDDVDVLVGPGEIAREQIVVHFAYLERVLATRIPFPKPLFAERVRNIKQMKLVGRIRPSDQ